MAVAEIIGAAIGVMLLVIVAYMLVGSVLTTADVVTTAQKDVTLLSEARLKTSITINKPDTSIEVQGLNFSVTNTGNEIISDFNHMDVYTWDGSSEQYQRYIYNKNLPVMPGNWSVLLIERDSIHPGKLDPGEKMWIWATFPGANPLWFQVTTSNGVNAQTTYP